MFIHATTPAGQGGSEVFQSSISPFRLGPVCNILKQGKISLVQSSNKNIIVY